MKIGVLVCVLLLAGSVSGAGGEDGAFEQAKEVPNANNPTFFRFTTSFGNYTIGNNGVGELGFNGKRRLFYLHAKIRLVGRLRHMYFREYQRDLLLLYQVSDGRVYLARMNQESKQVRWFTLIEGHDVGPCVVKGEEAHCGESEDIKKIDLKTGHLKSADPADLAFTILRIRFTESRISFFSVGM
jgi:hypothetical protein